MSDLRRTARITGLCYLGLAVTGALGFLLARPAIYAAQEPATTARNLVDKAALAHLAVALELGVVLTQALAAVWFYKLFRALNAVAAGSLAAFGLINATAILGSAAFMASALAVSRDAGLAPGGDVTATVQLMFVVSSKLWSVGAVFFGLWLIPMGHIVARTGCMPKALGGILMAGGVGYILSAFVSNGVAMPPTGVADVLTIPASIGEFWMIGYLLSVGIRPAAASAQTRAPQA